jgi:hypothetical protein
MRTGALTIAHLGQLPCPRCGEFLERGEGRYGLVWICVPVLRKVAPRGFVNAIWQAALHDGRPSRHACPGCTHPFVALGRRHAAPPQVEVCVRCYWVWFDSDLLAAFAANPLSLAAVAGTLTSGTATSGRRAASRS